MLKASKNDGVGTSKNSLLHKSKEEIVKTCQDHFFSELWKLTKGF